MRVTDHFSLDEFSCKDGTPVPLEYMENILTLALQLEALREKLGSPVRINSAYRTETYNRRIGGVRYSQHLSAKAADITSPGHTPKQIAQAIEDLIAHGRMVQGGIGIYKSFVHYDIRGQRVRWVG